MPTRLLSLDVVCQLTGLSQATIYRRMRDLVHPFPCPRRLSPGCVRWSESDVDAWIGALPYADLSEVSTGVETGVSLRRAIRRTA